MRLSEIKLLGPFDDQNMLLINSQFQADRNGHITFFSWGKYGRGYKIVDLSQEAKIRDFLINWYRLPWVLLFLEYFLLKAFTSFKIIVVIIIISLLIWLMLSYVFLKILTKDLRYSTAKYRRIK
jgi:hypothetical protein